MKWIGQIVNDVKVNFSNDGEIYVIGDDLYIENVTQDKDIIFKTNDGGTATEVMRIDGSTSNIGIRTTSPTSPLDIHGESISTNRYYLKTFTSTGQPVISIYNANSDTTPVPRILGTNSFINMYNGITIRKTAGSGNILTVSDVSNVEKLIVDTSGNVGIGTTSPASLLHVEGAVQIGVNDAGHDFTLYGDTANYNMMWDASSSRLEANDNVKFNFGTGNDLSIYHTGSHSNIEASGTGDLKITQATDDGDMIFQCDDGSGGVTPYLTLDGSTTHSYFSAGNVGIGTSSPASKLHVAGTVQVGVDDTGHDVKFFGATSGRYLLWDESADALKITDNAYLQIGSGDDLRLKHDGTDSLIDSHTGNLYIRQQANDKDIIFQCDDGSGGVTTYLTLDGSATNMKVAKDMRFNDNVDAEFGTSGDFKIYHDGSNTYLEQINAGTGNIVISNANDDADIIFQSDDGSGGTTPYLTLDGGLGRTTVQKNMQFADNAELWLGDGPDFKMFHDGSNTHLQQIGTGDLYIQNTTDDKDIIFQSDNGSGGTETYFFLDGSAGGSNPRTVFPDDSRLCLGSGHDLKIFNNGSDSFVSQETDGDLYIRNIYEDKDVIFQSDDGSGGETAYLTLDGSSGYTKAHKHILYEDNAKAMFGTGGDMQILHDGSNSYISQNVTGALYIENNATDGDVILRSDDGSGGTTPYLTLDGGLGYITVQKRMQLQNSIGLYLGTSTGDLIYHNGSNTFWTHQVGDLTIESNQDDGDIIFKNDDGSGGKTAYLTLDGSHTETVFSESARFDDSKEARFGVSSDLKIYHNGSNSYIQQQGTGDLYIMNTTNDKDIIFVSDDGSGGTTAYLTLDGGLGYTTVQKRIRFDDAKEVQLGASGDLSLKHVSNQSYIDNSTGNLNIRQKANDGDIVFECDDGSGGDAEYLRLDGGSEEVIFFKPIVTAETQIKVLPHHFMSNEDGGANKSAQFRDDTIIGVRTSSDDAELYAFVEIPYGKTARTVTVYGNDTSLVVNVYESDINAGALTDKTPGAGCVVGTECDITDVAYSATNYLVIKVTTVSYTNDIVYGAVVTIG